MPVKTKNIRADLSPGVHQIYVEICQKYEKSTAWFFAYSLNLRLEELEIDFRLPLPRAAFKHNTTKGVHSADENVPVTRLGRVTVSTNMSAAGVDKAIELIKEIDAAASFRSIFEDAITNICKEWAHLQADPQEESALLRLIFEQRHNRAYHQAYSKRDRYDQAVLDHAYYKKKSISRDEYLSLTEKIRETVKAKIMAAGPGSRFYHLLNFWNDTLPYVLEDASPQRDPEEEELDNELYLQELETYRDQAERHEPADKGLSEKAGR